MAMYDAFAKTFSSSRKNMKWWEIEYFLDFVHQSDSDVSLLDVWCGNGRLLDSIQKKDIQYLWIDSSSWLLDQAKKLHPNHRFLHLDMCDIDTLEDQYDFIFFIASFHHLDTPKKREKVLSGVEKLLKKDWLLFMTNWALDSEINTKKYSKSQIPNTVNSHGWTDYSIKLGEHTRYYHCFSLEELEYHIQNSWLILQENRLFENKKNFITIAKKS